MASVSDLYSSRSSSLPVDWVRGAINENEASADAGLQKGRLQKEFATRDLPDLVNRFASRGTFYSGSTGVQADRLREDADNNSADVDRMLARTRNQLALNRFLAAVGLG